MLLLLIACQAEEIDTGCLPTAELRDGFDNDCDGLIDEDAQAMTAYEGCGAQTVGGRGGEEVVVTTLADDGPGSLREALTVRAYDGETLIPRLVRFDVAGTIEVDSLMRVDLGSLTVDGASAPAPGITLQRGAGASGIMQLGPVSEVILSHLRFLGRWESGEDGENDVGTFGVFGGDEPPGAQRIVLDHLSAGRANDYGPDIWGEVSDVTLSWSFLYRNRHPTTVSHHPEPFATRDCISIHHNLWALNGERNPQARGDVKRLSLINNLIYGWGQTGSDRGYGVRIRADAGEPAVDAALIGNVFLATRRPDWALVYGQSPGADDDGALGALYLEDNLLPEENVDHYATTDTPPDTPAVTTAPAAQVVARLLEAAGMAHRSDEEAAIVAEIRAGAVR